MTVTVSIPWPTLSISSLILSPTEILATDVTWMLVAPAGASARQEGLRARLADRGDCGHFVLLHGSCNGGIGGAIAEGDLLADPKPDTLVTGTLVEPAGIVITGPSGRGCHSVVWLLAAVPRFAILRVSALEPVSMLTVSPTDMPVVLLTWMVVSPARAGTAKPGVGEAEQVEAASRELRPGRDLHRREDGLLGRVLGQGPVGDVDAPGRRRYRAR